VIWLHSSNDTIPRKSGKIGWIKDFNMLDTVSSIARRINPTYCFIGIESHPDSGVADRVACDLKPAPIRFNSKRLKVLM
jgi:hypothetical protein